MSTWTYDLATDIGKVRLLISDTDIIPVTDAQFSDEEIQVFLTMEGSVNLAAALALETWATIYSMSTDSESIGDYSYTQNVTNKMLELAKRYRENEATGPVIDWGSFNLTDTEE
jgi:hypothetical protein